MNMMCKLKIQVRFRIPRGKCHIKPTLIDLNTYVLSKITRWSMYFYNLIFKMIWKQSWEKFLNMFWLTQQHHLVICSPFFLCWCHSMMSSQISHSWNPKCYQSNTQKRMVSIKSSYSRNKKRREICCPKRLSVARHLPRFYLWYHEVPIRVKS